MTSYTMYVGVNIVHALRFNSVHLIFVHVIVRIEYENISTAKISRFTVYSELTQTLMLLIIGRGRSGRGEEKQKEI